MGLGDLGDLQLSKRDTRFGALTMTLWTGLKKNTLSIRLYIIGPNEEEQTG